MMSFNTKFMWIMMTWPLPIVVGVNAIRDFGGWMGWPLVVLASAFVLTPLWIEPVLARIRARWVRRRRAARRVIPVGPHPLWDRELDRFPGPTAPPRASNRPIRRIGSNPRPNWTNRHYRTDRPA